MEAFQEFKVGDRVKLIAESGSGKTAIGSCGTIKEASIAPWVHFDKPTGCQVTPSHLDIPMGYADCVSWTNLELIGSETDTTERDALAKQLLFSIHASLMEDESWDGSYEAMQGIAKESFDLADAYMAEKERRKS